MGFPNIEKMEALKNAGQTGQIYENISPSTHLRRRDGDEPIPPVPPHILPREIAENIPSHYTNKFLSKSGYRLLEDLQRAIETGSLLQQYDLDIPCNRIRYNRQANPRAAPPVAPLIGSNSPAPNSPTYDTLDHKVVSQLDPAGATSPRGTGILHTIAQYLPFRDIFYHRDKQREVAKGLEDLYKELQRLQTQNSDAILTTKRKLTAAEAGRIISLRKYKTARSTLEQLAVDLGYVGEIDITYGIPPHGPTNVVYRTPTPKEIRQSYGRITANPKTWLQAIPDEVLAGIRTLALTGVVVGAAVGAYAPLAAYIGGRAVSGVITSTISHFVRQAGREYITHEDGLQNTAELAGRIGGLAAYSGTAALIGGSLAIGYVTAMLAGSAVTRYVANKKRQNARDTQRQLEDVLQTRTDNPAMRNTINQNIVSAERYEAASAGLDILSLLGMGLGGLGSLGGIHLPGGSDTSAPTIGNITTQTAVHVGDSAKYSFDVNDTPWTGHVENVNIAVQDPTGAVTSGQVYPLSFFERVQHFFGDSSITEKGAVDAKLPGQYTVTINADDHAGNTATPQSFTINVTEGTTPGPLGPEPTPGPQGPEPTPGPSGPGGVNPLPPCDNGQLPFNTNLANTRLDLREVYDYHNTLLRPEAGHEQGLDVAPDWKSGSVSFNGLHDEHIPCDFNVDDTVVMLEHYGDNTVGHKTFTDAQLNTPDYRVIVDVTDSNNDGIGEFVVPTEFANYNGDDIQVTWAKITHYNCEKGQLGLEDLASYTNGQHVVVSKEAVFDGNVPAHVAPHYITCDDHPVAPVHPAPTVPTPEHDFRITPIPIGYQVEDTAGHPVEASVQSYAADGSIVREGQLYYYDAGAGSVQEILHTEGVAKEASTHIWGDDIQFKEGRGDELWIKNGTADNTLSYSMDSQIGLVSVVGSATPAQQAEVTAPSTLELSTQGIGSATPAPDTLTPEPSTQSIGEDAAPAFETNIPASTQGVGYCPTCPTAAVTFDTDNFVATMSYEDILRLWQDYYRIIDVKTIA